MSLGGKSLWGRDIFSGTRVFNQKFESPIDDRISYDYRRGPYLIYNCEEKHYVCVEKENYRECHIKRDFALKMKLISMPCAPIKKYEDVAKCTLQHKALINKSHFKGFCKNIQRP